MTTAFPGGIDPEIGSSPGQTLDQADHTNLHNTLSSGMNKVQLFLGITPTGGTEPAGKSMRQRLLDAEKQIVATQPVANVLVTDRAPATGATVAWDASGRVITLGIPEGKPGKDGTNGVDGVSLVAASGTVSQQTVKAGAVVGLDVSYGKDLGFVPKIVCTPIQDTVGTSGGTTTSHIVTNATVTSARYATYQGDGIKRTGAEATAGTLWHGMYSTNNGHQHGIVTLGDMTTALKDATITKVTVKIVTPASTVENYDSDQITVHQSNLATPPASHLNSAVTGVYYTYKKLLTVGTTFTFDLPTTWHAGFKSGAIASLIFGPERDAAGAISNTLSHYGAIHAPGTVVSVYYTLTTPTSSVDVDSIPVDVGVRKVTQTGFRLVVRNSGAQDEKVRVSWMASP